MKGNKKRTATSGTSGISAKQLRMRMTTDDPAYKGMRKIKLSGKELANLPLELFKLAELEVLELSPEREACLFYHVQELPTVIGNLSQLRVLAVDTNKLSFLPEQLSSLLCLERLAVSNNLLSYLPSSFSRLTNLQSLCCSNNRFEELPRSICQLKSLVFLDFSGNSLTRLPQEIGSMDSLESLVLSYNRIQELPESICNLRTLRLLWLSGNCLTQLPRGFSKLKNLDWSDHMLSATLDDNPLEHPPLAIARQGPDAIEKYLSLHLSNSNKPSERKSIY
ncbi:uncharacterized protein [Watersipora subatra]|uniref:uncharacterized protein isoform X1 n=1 Tax=Watersipora subatra TaxID=2589382 RepID=UPI00355B10D6